MAYNQLNSFQKWSDARRLLDDAIQCYLERTTELAADVFNLIRQPYDLSSLKTAISEADKEAQLMSFRADKLQKATGILKTIHGASNFLIPIDRLPSELLLRIFYLSLQERGNSCVLYDASMSTSSSHRHYDSQTLLALTHVCTHWRTIVISNSSFWSHVDLPFGDWKEIIKIFKRIELWLERAHNLPLCLWVDGHISLPNQGLAVITNNLQPRLGDIGVLQLEDFGDYSTLLEFISLWLTHGRPGSVHTLTIRLYQTLSLRQLYSTNEALSHLHVESFLKPIRVLRLHGVYFGWGSSVYHNLSVLQLGGLREQESPTLREMLDVLSACPQLHTLQFQEMSILSSGVSRQPVPLSALKRFELIGVDSNSLRRLLPMINIQSQQLSLRILIWEFPASDCAISDSAVQAFLLRSNITRLYISAFANGTRIAEYLSAVPNLNTLIVLCNPKESDDILAAFMRSSESSMECTPRCPQLHTLYLINGRFRRTSIQQMVKNQPLIKKLRFQSCTFDTSEQELLSGLKSFVKDVYCDRSGTENCSYWYYSFI